MKFLPYQASRNAYNRGYILQNRENREQRPIVFQLLGYHFTSTAGRANTGRHYKLDNPRWVVYSKSLRTKLKLILTKQVTLIK